ncbi:MAG: hypothetical protein HY897_24150 [Deltaproteobacteria bacterium]|nr:hypothetical protein [Deltaproteobacteria bacterium]
MKNITSGKLLAASAAPFLLVSLAAPLFLCSHLLGCDDRTGDDGIEIPPGKNDAGNPVFCTSALDCIAPATCINGRCLIPEDAGVDAAADAETWDGADSGLDAGPGTDAGTDSGPDGGHDGGLDAGLDAGGDAGSGTCDNTSPCAQGCCAGTTCIAGTNDIQCGTGALACEDCTTSSKVCIDQRCENLPACNKNNCGGGCCLNQTDCMPGDTDTICGAGGSACKDCASDGKECKYNSCVIPAICDAANCANGCCLADKTCKAGDITGECGSGGATCADCSLDKLICVGKKCLACDSITCPGGCCDAGGLCQPGDKNDLCGTGGAVCVNCAVSSEKVCHEKACTPCGAATCGTGCCDAAGNCVTVPTNTQCGANGAACQDCTATAARYCFEGSCSTCNATTCPGGCCDAGGGCLAGTSNNSCGTGGASCANCESSGKTCINFTCQMCDAATCPDGCCDADLVCQPGTADAACGLGGAGCVDCDPAGTQRACTNKACICNKTLCKNKDHWNCCLPATQECVDGYNPEHCGDYGDQCVKCKPDEECDWGSQSCVSY